MIGRLRFTSTVGALFAVWSVNVWAEVPTAAVESYLAGARAVVAELELAEPNAASIVASITEMLEHAKPVATAYAGKHTQCAPQVTRMIELYPEIDRWSAQEIRRMIEGGTALPPAEGCYAVRDIVAHPAIVRAIVRSGIQPSQRQRLLREMGEAVEHMEEIHEDLSLEVEE